MNSNWIDRFSYKHRRFGIPNLMSYIIVSMFVFYMVENYIGIPVTAALSFSRAHILQGQVWRLITFVLLPSSYSATTISSLFSFFISLILYYTIGNDLEAQWGTAVFNLYYLIGVVGTILGGLVTGYTVNGYINLSLFLAYAITYPNAQFRFFFLVPIKAKYVGMASALMYLYQMVTALLARQWTILVAQIVSLINLFIFYGPTMLDTVKRSYQNKKRRKEFEKNLRSGPWNQ